MDTIEFLQKQNEIYTRFKDEDKILNGGIVPNIKPQQSGYLVVFRHPDSITEKVQELSEKADKIFPGVIYGKNHVHTTITDYKLTEEDFNPDKEILKNLTNSMHDIRNSIILPIIDYSNWYTNPNTIIAAGKPDDENFLDIAKKYLAATENYGISSDPKEGGVRMPWSTHITTFRYDKKVGPVEGKELIAELFNLIKTTPALGKSQTEFIDVGYFTIKGKDMIYTIHERFKI